MSEGWTELVDRVRANDAAGMEELYRVLSKGVRFYLCRQLGPQDLDDRLHDTFLVVTQAIRKGELREPERLMGFVRTIVRRQVAAHIDQAVQRRRKFAGIDVGLTVADHEGNPEQEAIERQRVEVAGEVLRSISSRDREILTRFYLDEQYSKGSSTRSWELWPGKPANTQTTIY